MTMSRRRTLASWSSGKDAAWAFHIARTELDYEPVAVLTTLTAPKARVTMHGVRESLLLRQVELLGLPLVRVDIPSPCADETYAACMGAALDNAKKHDFDGVIFGDLFLGDVRAYREWNLARVGLKALFPLWERDTGKLAREMIDHGLKAIVTCVDTRKLPRELAGRDFDTSFLADLPEGVDPCGENGEFHTVVVGGPMFPREIDVVRGAVVEREGFVFADVLPVDRQQKRASEIASELGFDLCTPLDPRDLEPEGRILDFCKENKCGSYRTNHMCPPLSGSVHEAKERLHGFESGVLVQWSKSIDVEANKAGVHESMAAFHEMLLDLEARLHDDGIDRLHGMIGGSCRLCDPCTAVDEEPCAHPDRARSSLEANYVDVLALLESYGLDNAFHSNRVTWTGCVLF